LKANFKLSKLTQKSCQNLIFFINDDVFLDGFLPGGGALHSCVGAHR